MCFKCVSDERWVPLSLFLSLFGRLVAWCGGLAGGCWWLCVYVLGPSEVHGSGVRDENLLFRFNQEGEEDEDE